MLKTISDLRWLPFIVALLFGLASRPAFAGAAAEPLSGANGVLPITAFHIQSAADIDKYDKIDMPIPWEKAEGSGVMSPFMAPYGQVNMAITSLLKRHDSVVVVAGAEEAAVIPTQAAPGARAALIPFASKSTNPNGRASFLPMTEKMLSDIKIYAAQENPAAANDALHRVFDGLRESAPWAIAQAVNPGGGSPSTEPDKSETIILSLKENAPSQQVIDFGHRLGVRKGVSKIVSRSAGTFVLHLDKGAKAEAMVKTIKELDRDGIVQFAGRLGAMDPNAVARQTEELKQLLANNGIEHFSARLYADTPRLWDNGPNIVEVAVSGGLDIAGKVYRILQAEKSLPWLAGKIYEVSSHADHKTYRSAIPFPGDALPADQATAVLKQLIGNQSIALYRQAGLNPFGFGGALEYSLLPIKEDDASFWRNVQSGNYTLYRRKPHAAMGIAAQDYYLRWTGAQAF